MAQYYTLDEASRKLGITGEELRRKLATEWKTLRRFPDGNTLRFQARDIDELARTLGRASEAEIHTGEEPLSLSDEHAGGPKSDFIPLASDESALSVPKVPKSGSDSDVKLQAGDSGRHAPDHGSTEELNLAGPNTPTPSGPKTPAPAKGGSSKKLPPQRPASEMELSLDAGSDDFDLQLTDDESDEINIGRGGRGGKRPGDSGINLQDPADSGISLEKDSSEFELQLESDAPKKPTSSGKINKSPSSKKIQPVTPPPSKQDSDSEFELTLDEGSDAEATPFDSGEQKDIFETDFEIPAVDDSSSGSQTDSALDDSDFEISDASDDESASEVVAIEEEDMEDDLKPIDEGEPEIVTAASLAPPKPATWGLIPVIGGSFTLVFMFFVTIMSYELLHSMWGYHAPVKVAGGFVRTVGEWFGELPKD